MSVLDAVGTVVHCSERGERGCLPTTVAIGDGPPRRVLATAGPWLIRPTLPGRQRRAVVRLQVVLECDNDDIALLIAGAIGGDPQWTIDGEYEYRTRSSIEPGTSAGADDPAADGHVIGACRAGADDAWGLDPAAAAHPRPDGLRPRSHGCGMGPARCRTLR
ncbi:hypothetical protein [Amycolatopsis sp. MEPSY49]|uniref:hypothetical protein n=1 Tax=Amycolatopsis sp. MEPSY49 TaxID=3151600 RepID=UPI003EF72BF8